MRWVLLGNGTDSGRVNLPLGAVLALALSLSSGALLEARHDDVI